MVLGGCRSFLLLVTTQCSLHLTNRFHFAMHLLLSNRSQVTSKCGKNKTGGTQGNSQVCH